MNRRGSIRALAAALLWASVSARAQPAPDPDARARALFQKPLIIGASVSAGFRAESPGERVARKLGTVKDVVSFASPGAGGANQVKALTPERLSAATVVVGVDLFFWDTQRDCGAGLAGVDDLFQRLGRTPIVLGNVPGLRGDACRAKINERIGAACAADPACVLLDLDKFYAQAVKDGGVELDGKRLTLHDLQPDGLHLSDAGSELVARAILDALRK